MKKKPTNILIEGQDFEVKGASIIDGICHYSIHVRRGMGIGTHNVKGEGIVDVDMEIAFSKLNVHLAIIDGVFKHKEIDIDKVSKFHKHEITAEYTVNSFKINGEEDNLSVILNGSKHVANGQMDLKTPKIILDNMGGYQFYKELKDSVDNAKLEVELYIKGKFTPVEPPEESNPKQLTIGAAIEEAELAAGKVK
jgi:hypothetical protein